MEMKILLNLFLFCVSKTLGYFGSFKHLGLAFRQKKGRYRHLPFQQVVIIQLCVWENMSKVLSSSSSFPRDFVRALLPCFQ